MKNKGLVVLGMVTGILLTIAFFWNGTSGQAQAGGNHDPFLSTPSLIASSADEGDHPVYRFDPTPRIFGRCSGTKRVADPNSG